MKPEELKLKDFLASINHDKKALLDKDEADVRLYKPFVVNRCLSYFPDTIFHANEMNCVPWLDNKIQFDFHRLGIRKKKRFSPWLKKETETDISITSFYSSHLITAAGSGGMLMINDKKILKRATMFRDWGRIGDNSEDVKTRFEYEIDGIPYDYKFLYGAIGYNMKSSELNSAFGLVQIGRLEEIRSKRKQLFQRYLDNLKDVSELVLPINTFNSDWLAIPFMYKNRLELLTFLENNSIQTRVCFAGNITRHPVYREYLQEFPNSDRIMSDGFLLGAHHGMTEEDVDYVCNKIKQFIYDKPN